MNYPDEIYKTCARCKEDWPPDEEFYFSPTDLTCRACKYEVRKAQKERARKRREPISS